MKQELINFLQWFLKVEEDGSVPEIINKPHDFVVDYYLTNILK